MFRNSMKLSIKFILVLPPKMERLVDEMKTSNNPTYRIIGIIIIKHN